MICIRRGRSLKKGWWIVERGKQDYDKGKSKPTNPFASPTPATRQNVRDKSLMYDRVPCQLSNQVGDFVLPCSD
jgi:hypothetical protein